MNSRSRIQLPIAPDPAVARTAAPASPAGMPDVRIGLVTLGCDKNTVDSERLLARLAGAGARVQEGARGADVVVVNTCGFIDAAKEESIDALLDAVRLKKQGHARAVVAVGCLVQRYKEQLAEELPEVDLFLGLTEAEQLVPSLRARGLLADTAPNMQQPLRRLATTTRHTSYLKVSEGCDHTCAFCAIPLMRGKHRSLPIEQLVQEARELEASGVVELNLISQDTTWYGRDLQRGGVPAEEGAFVGRAFNGMRGLLNEPVVAATNRGVLSESRRGMLPQLLTTLLAETSIPWLRLFYMYPSGITRELVEVMAENPRILPYLDMPIQHGSDRILERMRRPERQATIRERVRWLRAALPDLALRTTVIVGFPGETDEDFQAMLELLEEIRFDYLGAFAYSVEENTPAATMTGQVADTVKRERLEQLLDLQRAITLEKNEQRVGSVVPVLIDRVVGRSSRAQKENEPRGAVGRTRGQALEVDGVVHIANGAELQPGAFVQVKLVEAVEQDFSGEVVAERA
jgi:ribosomal protein S12 methylthiotransferase